MDCKTIIQENVNNNARQLAEFLRSKVEQTGKGNSNTNLIEMSLGRTYRLVDEGVYRFFDYLEACRTDTKWKMLLHYAESQDKDCSGIMLDFDIYQKVPHRLIDEAAITTIIKKYLFLLLSTLEVKAAASTNNKRNTSRLSGHCFVIQKLAPKAIIGDKKYGNCYKDGFHILFPEIQVSRPVKKYLIKQFKNTAIFEDVIEEIEGAAELIHNPAECLDPASSSVPVLFLGSCKKGAEEPYPLALTIKYSVEHNSSLMSNSCECSKVTPPSKANLCYELSLSFKLTEYVDSTEGKFIPAWLKKQAYAAKVHLVPEIETFDNSIVADNRMMTLEEEVERSVAFSEIGNPDITFYKKLLNLLDPSYYEDYKKWRDVIFALGNTSPTFENLGRWFSMKSAKWDPAAFDRLWAEAIRPHSSEDDESRLTKASLFYWAQQADPDGYRAVRANFYHEKIMTAVFEYEGILEHDHIARALYEMMHNKFVTDTDGVNRIYTWYEFIMPEQSQRRGEVFKWRRCGTEPGNLLSYISEALDAVFKELLLRIKQLTSGAENEQASLYFKKVEKNFRSVRAKLAQKNFRNGIIDTAKFRFIRHGFIDSLDSYPDVLGVGNGILKLGKDPYLLRTFHEYNVSMYTETDYIPYDPANPYIRKIEDVFRSIYIEPDVYEFMMMYFSRALGAEESEPMILFLVGGGQNGKTISVELIAETLGQYAAKLPIALIIGDRERAEGANEAMMHMVGKRFCRFSEPQRIETLNTGRMKELTGGEKQTGRKNYGHQTEFKVTATFIVCSNYDFHIDSTDHGTWRRIFLYNPKMKFCEHPDPDNDYERKEDPTVAKMKNDPNYKQAMLSILVHYNKILHIKYGGQARYVPCPTIKKETEMFRNRQDAINKFIKQMLIKIRLPSKGGEKVEKSQIMMEHLAKTYLTWYHDNVDERGKITLKDVLAQFYNSSIAKSITKEHTRTFLVGYRLRKQEEVNCDSPLITYDEDGIAVEAVGLPVMTSSSSPTPSQSPLDDEVEDNIGNEHSPENNKLNKD